MAGWLHLSAGKEGGGGGDAARQRSAGLIATWPRPRMEKCGVFVLTRGRDSPMGTPRSAGQGTATEINGTQFLC